MAIVNTKRNPTPQPDDRLRRLGVGEQPTATVGKTLGQACAGMVDDAAGRLLWRQGFRKNGVPGTDRVSLRAEIWRTPEGLMLRDLCADRRFAGLELSKAKAAIARNPKAAEAYRPALALLARGRFDAEAGQ